MDEIEAIMKLPEFDLKNFSILGMHWYSLKV